MDVGMLIFEGGAGVVPARLSLKPGANAIGRGKSNDIVLDHPGVSNYHALIIVIDGEYRLRDVKSSNGTFVDGRRLEPDVDYILRPGERVSFGPLVYRFEREVVPAPPPEPAPLPLEPAPLPPPSELPPNVAGKLPTRPPRPSPRPFPPRLTPPGESSRYLALLPPIYAIRDEGGVLNAILLICQQILEPLEQRVIGQIHYYLDPATAPEPMLAWLAAWVDLVLDESWPTARRRALVAHAAELYRWRGTARGLREYLQIFTGAEPTIQEPGRTEGHSLPRGALRVEPGRDDGGASLMAPGPGDRRPLEPFSFRVLVPTSEQRPAALARLHQIIEAEKPAHTSYTLYVCPPASSER